MTELQQSDETARTAAGDPPELTAFYAQVAAYELQPLWTQTAELMTPTPKPRSVPWAWHWDLLHRLASRSGDLVPVERGGERRVLALSNPGLGGLPYATETLWGAVQFLGPRESAPAHRHSPGAVRFVLEGTGVWTMVNGDACSMRPGDLVLTPGWAWHEHHNLSDDPMIWFDGLDLPMVAGLGGVFFQPREELDLDAEKPAPPVSRSELVHGAAGVVPDPLPSRPAHSPLLVYRWKNTDAALGGLLDTTGERTARIRFTDPTTGGDALPTMRCAMERVLPGARTPSVRTTGSSVYVVRSGSGRSVVGGTAIDWRAGDMFAVPSWAAVDHEVGEPSDLFQLSDAPAMEALRLDRHETLEEHQEVRSVFRAPEVPGASRG
ncbi:cupin domain-containing protein [Streptomyces sp. NPDC050560]|uniref:cupin domain-containing protein n=1 Tax=Streptomyces sp. NPDC050560 TaxID=3365630 RepID=UPI0037B111F0